MDAAEYKHVVLGLISLTYISDAFEERHAAVLAEFGEDAAEDRDEYTAENIFWVPTEARWSHLKAQARQSTVGLTVDQAMAAIERDNPGLKDVLPRDYARPALDKRRLGQLIDLISNIRVGDEDARSRDVLGRVYEYFLSQFASAEGKKGGEFYTPRCVVKVLVEMLEPYRGRVFPVAAGVGADELSAGPREHGNERGNVDLAQDGRQRCGRRGRECSADDLASARDELQKIGDDGPSGQGSSRGSGRRCYEHAQKALEVSSPKTTETPASMLTWIGTRITASANGIGTAAAAAALVAAAPMTAWACWAFCRSETAPRRMRGEYPQEALRLSTRRDHPSPSGAVNGRNRRTSRRWLGCGPHSSSPAAAVAPRRESRRRYALW